MSNYIIGELKEKMEIKEITDNFSKREFVVVLPDAKGNTKYDQFIIFSLINKNMYLIDDWRIGDEIKIYFDLKGRQYKDRYYNELVAWKIEGQKYDRPIEKKEEPKKVDTKTDDDDLPF